MKERYSEWVCPQGHTTGMQETFTTDQTYELRPPRRCVAWYRHTSEWYGWPWWRRWYTRNARCAETELTLVSTQWLPQFGTSSVVKSVSFTGTKP